MDSPSRQVALRSYIDTRINEYLQQLQNLAKEFSKNNSNCVESASRAKVIRGQIRNLIKIFEEVLKVPSHLRQQIANVKGMSSQQITDKKIELQKLLAQYLKMAEQEGIQEQNKRQVINTEIVVMNDSLKDLNDAEPLAEPQVPNHNKQVGRFLLVLEGVSYIIGLTVIIIYFYNLVIK